MSKAQQSRFERWFPGLAAAREDARRRLANSRLERALIDRNTEAARNMSYRGGVPTRIDTPYDSSSSNLPGANHPLRVGILREMRDRSRQLDRDNTLASSLLDRAVENVIGNGLMLQARTDDPIFNAAAEKLHKRWGEELADIRGLFSYCELQQLHYRSQLRDGDVGEVLVDQGGVPRLQTVEGDLIESPPGRVGQDGVYDGIQWDANWRPLNYYVRVVDPVNRALKHQPVFARNFVFMPRMSRTSALRGEPIFAQSFYLFDHFDGYVEAVVTAARAGACQALLIKREAVGPLGGGVGQVTNSDGDSQSKFRLEPLLVHRLKPGEDVASFNPSQPQQNFPQFLGALGRLMGLKLGLTLEQVMLDFSQTNYSSSRAARLQADSTAYKERKRFEAQKLRREYRWWVSKMVNQGQLPPAPADYWAHEWVGEPRPWVDPEKEIKAALIELDMGLTTLTLLAKERGREFAQLLAQRQEEIKAARKASVPVVMSNATREQGQNAPAAGGNVNSDASGSTTDGEASSAKADESDPSYADE